MYQSYEAWKAGAGYSNGQVVTGIDGNLYRSRSHHFATKLKSFPLVVGYNVIPVVYPTATTVTAITAEINAQGGNVLSIGKINTATGVYEVASGSATFSHGEAMQVLVDQMITGGYTPAQQSTVVPAYSFLEGYNSFSLTTNTSYTCAQLATEMQAAGAPLTKISYYDPILGADKSYSVPSGAGVNFTMYPDRGYSLRFTPGTFTWTPAHPYYFSAASDPAYPYFFSKTVDASNGLVKPSYWTTPAYQGGTWVTGITYTKGMTVVGTDGLIYSCTNQHVSASGNKPITGTYSGYWERARPVVARARRPDGVIKLQPNVSNDGRHLATPTYEGIQRAGGNYIV